MPGGQTCSPAPLRPHGSTLALPPAPMQDAGPPVAARPHGGRMSGRRRLRAAAPFRFPAANPRGGFRTIRGWKNGSLRAAACMGTSYRRTERDGVGPGLESRRRTERVACAESPLGPLRSPRMPPGYGRGLRRRCGAFAPGRPPADGPYDRLRPGGGTRRSHVEAAGSGGRRAVSGRGMSSSLSIKVRGQ